MNLNYNNSLNNSWDQSQSHERSIMSKLNKLNTEAYWIWCKKNKACFHCEKFSYIVKDCWDNKNTDKNKDKSKDKGKNKNKGKSKDKKKLKIVEIDLNDLNNLKN